MVLRCSFGCKCLVIQVFSTELFSELIMLVVSSFSLVNMMQNFPVPKNSTFIELCFLLCLLSSVVGLTPCFQLGHIHYTALHYYSYYLLCSMYIVVALSQNNKGSNRSTLAKLSFFLTISMICLIHNLGISSR